MSANQPQFPSHILDALQIFANTAWHNPSTFLRTHRSSTSRDVEYLHLQDHSLALRYLFGNSLASDNKVLVRDEYRQALQVFQTDIVYKQGAYVIGQSGIGKTSFLIYALIERLREHKPVVIQLRTSDSFYAHFAHTCTIYSSSDPTPLVQEDVWALGDLHTPTTPLDVFHYVSTKVIQVILPGTKYWEKWSASHGAQMFVMDTWSKEEIADLSSLLELDVDRMTALAAKWGGVPRTVLEQCMNDESQQDWELHRTATRAIENYITLLPGLHTLDSPDVGTSPIFFILPHKNHAGNIHRRKYTVRVPTATLQNALATALQQFQSSVRSDILLLMSIHSGTRGCAKKIYINWFLSLITSGKATHGNWDYIDSQLTRALNIRAKEVPVIRDASKHMDPPFYWIGSRREFPGVDCALVTVFGIYAIQIIVSRQPSCPQAGLDKLRNLLPAVSQKASGVPWTFLVVGISKDLVDNASRWANPSSGVPMRWCVVDPLEAGIPYKAYTDGNEHHDIDDEDE